MVGFVNIEDSICTMEAGSRLKETHQGKEDFDELHFIDRCVRNSALFAHFLISYDLFAIYKGTFKQSSRQKFKLYLRPELKMLPNKYEKWRLRLRNFWLTLYVPLVLRFITICLVQLARYQATIFVKKTAPLNGSQGSEEMSVPIVTDTELIVFLKRHKIYLLFENAWSDMTGLVLWIYISLLILFSYASYLIAFFYQVKPADAVALRIAINPRQERKRIDLTIQETIESLLTDILINRKVINWQQECPLIRSGQSMFEAASWRQWSLLMNKRFKFTFDAGLRPILYDFSYPKVFLNRAMKYLILVAAIFAPLGLMIQLNLVYIGVRAKCDLKELNNCTILEALSFMEFYSIIELIVVLYSFGYILTITVMDTMVHLDAQLLIVKEFKSDLGDLLAALELLRLNRSCSETDWSNQARVINQKELYLNDALLKSLAKTRISLADLKSQAGYVSEQMSMYVVVFCTCIVLALLTTELDASNMVQNQMNNLRLHFIVRLWIVANLLPLLCAYKYAQIMRLQKIGWSIQARIIQFKDIETVVRVSWRKLIEEGCFLNEQCSVHTFGIRMTFNRILQMNFYVLSLAVLILR